MWAVQLLTTMAGYALAINEAYFLITRHASGAWKSWHPKRSFVGLKVIDKGELVATYGLLHKSRRKMLPKRSGQPRIARFCSGSSVEKLQTAGKELKWQSRQTAVIDGGPRPCHYGATDSLLTLALPSWIPMASHHHHESSGELVIL